MNVYIICPVRLATPETTVKVEEYVKKLETNGHEVFWPQRDVAQDSDGLHIVNVELDAIATADEVHVFWDKNSKGSHFDLGAAMALDKPVRLIHSFFEDDPKETYEKVIKLKELEFSTMRLYL